MIVLGNTQSCDDIYFVVNDNQMTSINWYAGFKIIYVLAGSVEIIWNKQKSIMHAEDFLVINPFEPHSILPITESEVLAMHIPEAFFGRFCYHSHLQTFDCRSNACALQQERQIEAIRTLYARLFRAVYKQNIGTAFVYREVFSLIDILIGSFQREQVEQVSPMRRKTVEQFQDILRYLHQNYRSDLSIGEVSKAFYISPNNLSRYFQRRLHTTFTSYLSEIRLGASYAEVQQSDKPITEIALENGFHSVSFFVRCFKKRYEMTPSDVRRKRCEQLSDTSVQNTVGNDSERFLSLLKYLGSDEEVNVIRRVEERSLSVRIDQKGSPLQVTWKRLMNIGYASEGLIGSVQRQLECIQREIGFEYIRFQGLLDDDMMVYQESEEGIPSYCFEKIDKLLDFLLSIRFKPYLEFGFMPSQLAADKKNSCFFFKRSNLCMPNNNEKWLALVFALVEHLENRYGCRELEKWYFSMPSIHCAVLGERGGRREYEQFCVLYRQLYRHLKGRSTHYRLSGPGIYSNAIDMGYLQEFLTMCTAECCVPDQITLLCFPYEPISDRNFFGKLSHNEVFAEALSENESYVLQLRTQIGRILRQAGIMNAEITLVEWNSVLGQRDYSNDSCFKAAYLIKNLVENEGAYWGMGYWTANDMQSEAPPTTLPFHGGYGLHTEQGIPKSAYNALRLFNRMGNQRLLKEDGCLITQSPEQVQIIAYNYCHYDALYRNHYVLNNGAKNCYDRFVEKDDLRFIITLNNLKGRANHCCIRRYSINRDHGSAFDTWLAMGMPERLGTEEIEYLEAASCPQYQVESINTEGSLRIVAQVAPLEVQLITVDW